ncbi:hypothetical protein P5V15_013871 [Pogonomyrmex californicus]
MSDLRRGNIAKMQNISLQRETCQICYKDGHLASNCRKFIQNSQQNYEILICQICKKHGHDASKCRMRDPQSRRTVNVIRKNTIVCQLCSKTGHNVKSCRSTNQNKPLLICQWCDRQGHSANNCWKKQNELRTTENKARIIIAKIVIMQGTLLGIADPEWIEFRAIIAHYFADIAKRKGISSKTVSCASQVIIEEWQKIR